MRLSPHRAPGRSFPPCPHTETHPNHLARHKEQVYLTWIQQNPWRHQFRKAQTIDKLSQELLSARGGERHQGTEAVLRKDFYPDTAALAELFREEEEGHVGFSLSSEMKGMKGRVRDGSREGWLLFPSQQGPSTPQPPSPLTFTPAQSLGIPVPVRSLL